MQTTGAVSAELTGLAYLIAAICFIMALRGLSSPETARRGNVIGIAGMVIAIGTTLADPGVLTFGTIAAGILLGGAIGTVIALKIRMTALPQLVAAFHSLVGLAAVFVATAAFYAPEAYGIGTVGNILTASRIEMAIGTAIGAVTFSGSVVAFAKLQGLVSGGRSSRPRRPRCKHRSQPLTNSFPWPGCRSAGSTCSGGRTSSAAWIKPGPTSGPT